MTRSDPRIRTMQASTGFCLWCSPVRLAMEVLGLDFRYKSIKGILSMPGSQHDTSIVSHVERQPIALRQSRVPDNCLGNSYARLFPHFDTCVRSHMDLH